MSSTNTYAKPEFLSDDDIKQFESLYKALTLDSANILIISKDKNTHSSIYNFLREKLEQEDGKFLSLYHHERLESFLADSLLGPFENAFSKLTEVSSEEERPVKKILLINDVSKLDEREVNLLISLNVHKKKNSNPIVIFFDELTETKFDKSKLLKIFEHSIRWEPDLILPLPELDNKKTKNNPNKKNNTGKFIHTLRNFFLIFVLLVVLIGVLFFVVTKNPDFKKHTHQVLNYFKIIEIPFFDKKDIKHEEMEKNKSLEIKTLNLSELSQFHISTGYIIQYFAHSEKKNALEWIYMQKEIQNPQLIRLERNTDGADFYAVVSQIFFTYQQAVKFASDSFSGKCWVRSLESIKASQAKLKT